MTKEEAQKEIQARLVAAYAAVEEAEKLSEESGVPFRIDVGGVYDYYIPASMQAEKERIEDRIAELEAAECTDEAEDELARLQDELQVIEEDAGYSEFDVGSGWQNSMC